jgi:carbon storage regulator
MLVLSRKSNERILIGHDIEVVVLEVRGKTVRLGIRAPREVAVVRTELAAKLVLNTEPSEKDVPPEPSDRLIQSDDASGVSDQLLHRFCERRRNWRASGIVRGTEPARIAPEPEPASVVGLR